MKVSKRKDGRWWARIKMPNGKYQPVYAYSERECTYKAIQLQYEVQNNIYIAGDKTPLGDFLKEWIDNYCIVHAETTKSLYNIYLNKHILSDEISKIKLCELIPLRIQEYFVRHLPESSPHTINKLRTFLHTALSTAVDNSLIRSNPCDKVKRMKVPDTEYKEFTEKDYKRLLKIVQGSFDEIPIMLAGLCGLRRGEIFGLRWKDINFKTNTRTIKETLVRSDKWITKSPKNKTSVRSVKMPSILIEALKMYKSSLKVIPATVCDKCKPGTFSEHFKELIRKNNLPRIRFHDLRHFQGTYLMLKGIPDKLVSKRLGHSNVNTTKNIYQHAPSDTDSIIVSLIDKEFKTK
jgi:integrase